MTTCVNIEVAIKLGVLSVFWCLTNCAMADVTSHIHSVSPSQSSKVNKLKKPITQEILGIRQ